MAEIPDANTLDNYAYLQSLIGDIVKKIKIDIMENVKRLANSPSNSYIVIISSFLPTIEQIGEDYNNVLFEVCEIITRTLVSKGYKVQTDVSKNNTYSITLSWRKKVFEGKCPTFTKYLKNDNAP